MKLRTRACRALLLSVVACGVVASAQTTSSTNDLPPLTASVRFQWFVKGTVGPMTLASGLFTCGWGTLNHHPDEYDTHWEGFGQRYGMRLTGVATSKAMEAGIGALWGEDPRYVRAAGQPVRARLLHAAKYTFMATGRAGQMHPAYARYIASSGSSFLSNTWRPDSQANVHDAVERIGTGFLGQFIGNAFKEFMPDLKRRFGHGHSDG